MLTHESLEGRDEVIPGKHIYVGSKDEGMAPLEVGRNFPITDEAEKQMNSIIEEYFNVPLYLTLQRAQRQMTALEADARIAEQASILGPMTDRYNAEILSPAIKRTFAICMRAGRIPPPPPVVQQSKAKLAIDFVGYLAQLQKKHFQVGGMGASLEHIALVGKINPESLDVVDFDDLMREGLNGHGAPQKSIREIPDVQKIRQDRIKKQLAMIQAQQQMALQQKLAGNVDPNQPPVEGSPVSAVMGGQQ